MTEDEWEHEARALLENDPNSELAKGAVCINCGWKGRVGELIAKHDLHCPKCDSANWHPAGRDAIELAEYHGEIGTKN